MSKADQLRLMREANQAAGKRPVPSVRVKAPAARLQGPPEQQRKTTGVTAGEPATFGKPGRPLDKDRASALEATKPWLAEGLSRATWYRRRAEKRASDG